MTPPSTATAPAAGPLESRRVLRAAIWFPGLAVALGAAVATAHGLYEVAHAARVPAAIAWLYPLITDGLALIAYAATARLHGSAARYAWAVVVLAAGLSGLAQAMYLASDAAPAVPGVAAAAGPVFEASAALRFGVGAWPAVAAAIVAHLLYLLATDHATVSDPVHGSTAPVTGPDVQAEPFTPPAVQPERPAVQSVAARPVQPGTSRPVQRPTQVPAGPGRPALAPGPVERPDRRSGGSPARDRAWAAATRHAHRHGALPTVTELETTAEVSRGTAATVLKQLREHPAPLHLITNSTQQTEDHDAPSPQEHTQP